MLLLHFDNMAELLSWDVTPVVSICQAIKDYWAAAHLIEQQQISTHPSVILILMGNQFGFRKRIATEDAIFKLTNEILNALNSKRMVGIICCDLGKVFDSASKLPHYAISSKAKLLFESYLQNRYQRVQIINLCLNYNKVPKCTK